MAKRVKKHSIQKLKHRKVPSRKKRKSRFKPVVLLFFLFAIIGITYYVYKKDDKVITRSNVITRCNVINSIPEGFPSFGIDVSHHQGKIDWEKLFIKEHYDTIIQFVYCKATEGKSHVDTQWENNRQELQKLNIPNGAYHFFKSKTPPRPQVDHFLAHWKKKDTDLPPVLDVENEGFSNSDLVAKMKIWLIEVEKQTGMRPIIYTSLNFFKTKFRHDFKDYKFWIAAYSRKPDCIEDSRIIHWQYSETGELPGIGEKVDLNVSKTRYN